MSDKLKTAYFFIKIKVGKIINLLVKTATAYVVAGFAVLQVASIVVDNISTQEIFGMSSESLMQMLLIQFLPGYLLRCCWHMSQKARNSILSQSMSQTRRNLRAKITSRKWGWSLLRTSMTIAMANFWLMGLSKI